jgi:COP9 signalosome complex subunit 7
MDQAQARALAALEPFIVLATATKSPSHRFLADLITRATSAQGTYIFTELLQTPAIASLQSADTPPDTKAYLTLLEIFSYGTYAEYNSEHNYRSPL